jgi:ELWxxDGT repeat protein
VSTEADDAIISSAHDGWFVDLNPGDADSEPEDFVAGTALAKDIWAGMEDGIPSGGLDGMMVNGALLFEATDGASGEELWMSNGFPSGTALLRDINHGAEGGYPSMFTRLNNIAYFRADNGVHGTVNSGAQRRCNAPGRRLPSNR